MRVLLQDLKSSLYYCGGETWTSNRVDAFDFQFSAGQSEFDEKLALRDTRLVVDSECPVSLRGPGVADEVGMFFKS